MNTIELAKKIRIHALNMTNRAKSSHVGSALSIADIVAVLYGGEVLKFDSSNPESSNRDRFILSKGHSGAAIYAVLSELGFFSKELLDTYYLDGSILSGHISHIGVPGVEVSTGSLGHGLSIATGMAKALKLSNSNSRAFTLLSDGECDEGSTWEAAMFAGHHKLDNLVAIVDYNKIQSLKSVKETLDLEPFTDKWQSFGWKVVEVEGHDHSQLLSSMKKVPLEKNSPTVIIAHTIKGKGVSFMENTVLWHYRTPQDDEYEAALKELEAGI